MQPMFDGKQDKGDYITQAGLQDATNAALAQAKASGEFDGAQGPKGDTGEPGSTGPAGASGKDGLSINWRGEYTESANYKKNDAVSYDGSAYIMTSDSAIGAIPGIDDDWQLMAQKGNTGATGATGATGPAGAGLDVTGATVGQTVKISAVDSDGVPTAWAPVDMAGGGGWAPMDLVESQTLADGESVQYFLTGDYPEAHEMFVHFMSFCKTKDGADVATPTSFRLFWKANDAPDYGRLGMDIGNSVGTTTSERHVYIYLKRLYDGMITGKMFNSPSIGMLVNLSGKMPGTGMPGLKLTSSSGYVFEAGSTVEVYVR